jgi:hypothetical protein
MLFFGLPAPLSACFLLHEPIGRDPAQWRRFVPRYRNI